MTKTSGGKVTNPSRRKFIVGSVAAGGGLALGIPLTFGGSEAAAKVAATMPEVNAWVADQARRDGRDPHRALGDGPGNANGPGATRGGRARVQLEQSDHRVAYAGENLARQRVWGEMGTGGSRGIRTSEDYVRRGGAAARIMLLQSAADQWKVPVGELTVSDGIITHAASKRSTSYGKVAAAASRPTPPDPKSIKLKDPKDWKIAGKPVKRLDTAPKLNGSLVYAVDVKLDGMQCAAIKACPVFGGKLVSFDEAKIAGGRACGAQSRSTTRRSPSSRTRGGTPRPRWMRCRSSGTKGPAPHSPARPSPRI